MERRRNPTRVSKLHTGGTLTRVLPLVTPYDEDDALALSHEIASSADPLARFAQEARSLSWAQLNWLLCNHQYEYFILRYLAHHFDAPMSERLHGIMFPILRAVETHAVSTPTTLIGWRECGKSASGAFMMPVHSVVFPYIVELPDGRRIDMSKDYTVITSLIKGNASKRVQDIGDEFVENDDIRRDFGEFYSVSGRKPDIWNKSSLLTVNGFYFEAGSRRSAKRGLLARMRRPKLYIVDDVEDPQAVRKSKERRDDDFQWLTEEVIPACSVEKGNVLFHGNAFDERNMAMRLYNYAKLKGWQAHIFRVYEEDAETGQLVYTWPERFGPEFVKSKREELVLESAWQREYMQNPTTGGRDVSENDAQYYNYDEFVRTRLRYCRVYIACDPAISEARTADFTAVVPIALDPKDGMKYVQPVVHERGMPTETLVDCLIRQHLRYARCAHVEIGIESVAYQASIKQLLDSAARRLGLTVKTTGIKQTGNVSKDMRTERLWVPLKQGTLRFIPGDETHATLLHEIIYSGATEHDDLADAAEMADRLLNEDAERRHKRGGRMRLRTSG